MDLATLACGLALPWLLGIVVLAASGWPQDQAGSAGHAALRAGYGYFVGALLLTLWMRGVSAMGARFGWLSIGVPLTLIAAALAAYAVRSGHLRIAPARDALAALVRPGLPRWQQVAWVLLVAWLALRFALLGAEIAWQPLYPWEAWAQWATKARVWYEVGHIVPFVSAQDWLQGTDGFFDAAPNRPATVPLLQVWSSVSLGRWDDSAMNWPWLMMPIALSLAIYGALRAFDVAPLAAFVGAYLVASLPLLDVHVALAGYPDLMQGAVYALSALAFHRCAIARSPGDAALALFLALCCPLVTTAGTVWTLTLLPGVILVVLPKQGPRIVGAMFGAVALAVLALTRNEATLAGHRLHLDFRSPWNALGLHYFLLGNWNLLWYGAIPLAAIGWRRLFRPPLAPLAAVIAAGLAFLLAVFSFTNVAAWVGDPTAGNRATLHLAPLLVCFGMLLWRELTASPEPKPVVADAGLPPVRADSAMPLSTDA